MNGSMLNKGFSLLEMVAVVALLAVAAAIVVPRLTKKPQSTGKMVQQQLNEITRTAQVYALESGLLTRVYIDLEKKRAHIERELSSSKAGKKKFERISIPYVSTSVALPEDFEIDQFLVKGKELMKHGAELVHTYALFYITSDGLAQEVTVRGSSTQTGTQFALVLNPFTSQFRVP